MSGYGDIWEHLRRDCELQREKKCQDEGVVQCGGHGEEDAECVDAE